MDARVQKKYPNVLITDDYGILNENDLATYTLTMTGRVSFAESVSGSCGYQYWQCFPTENISINLSTAMNDPDGDATNGEMMGRIKIIVNQKNVIHEYTLRRNRFVSNELSYLTDWHHLMLKEKYVCLGGIFADLEKKIVDGKKKKIYGWLFDKIKTKNGCLSYFSWDCD